MCCSCLCVVSCLFVALGSLCVARGAFLVVCSLLFVGCCFSPPCVCVLFWCCDCYFFVVCCVLVANSV